ncbi:MAG: UPF0236 family protein [Acetatifactor sp.]|nr:UPF0236 family protein [Acetatifactor sp.]
MGKKSIIQNIRAHLNTYMHKLHINRKYRDRLFCALFSQDREALLQLYNALHGTAYTDSSQLTVVTLDNIIYMKMVNDLAFVIAGVLNLYEHQSTYNPNMPLRFLLYIAEEYDRLIHQQDTNIYGGKLVYSRAVRFSPARCMTPTYAACDGQELENLSARQYNAAHSAVRGIL